MRGGGIIGRKEACFLGLILVILTLPFLLRSQPHEEVLRGVAVERLVIISPHNESIRAVFSEGFKKYMAESHGRNVVIDWRIPGGTSEIGMTLRSQFQAAFANAWKLRERVQDSLNEAVENFSNASIQADAASPHVKERARAFYLNSDVGIGIDLFFGGGEYDFANQAKMGHLVSRDASGKYGLEVLKDEHPEWFGDSGIPSSFSGENYRDVKWRWVGTCLSSFGIVYNRDVLRRLGVTRAPSSWEDLTDPKLFGQVALADPGKSGSVAKAYEMILQEQMSLAMQRAGFSDENETSPKAEDQGLRQQALSKGWERGMQLIMKMSANGRYFTDSASKIPIDVKAGNAAAGMCIDFYARAFMDSKSNAKGEQESRIGFVAPKGGTSTGADPIGMLRGAPHPELAHRFMEFVLSMEGQKLWAYRAGVPGGPRSISLRRMPIRKDFYQEAHREWMSDPEMNPYDEGDGFTYQPQWTSQVFAAMRFVIRATCVNPHPEQKETWKALIDADFPVVALNSFQDVGAFGYAAVLGKISSVLKNPDRIQSIRLSKDLTESVLRQYRLAKDRTIKK